MIVTLGSVRGAPGVTSWSLLLAAAWPAPGVQRVVLEADPDGGVLGARYGYGVDPGAISLAASLRRSGASAVDVAEHGRMVTSDVVVVPGPETPEQSSVVWHDAAASVATAISGDGDRAWFIDAGRLRPNSPSTEFVERSSLVLLLTLGNTEDLVQLRSTVSRIAQGTSGGVGVVVVGKPAHPKAEISGFLGTDNVWTVPASRNLPAETAAVFSGRSGKRSWLWRNALAITSEMALVTTAERNAVIA